MDVLGQHQGLEIGVGAMVTIAGIPHSVTVYELVDYLQRYLGGGLVLLSDCAGICESVGAVGVPCPHGSELAGEVSLLCCA